MKKRILIFLLAALLTVTGGPPSAAAAAPEISPFPDMPTDSWYYPYVTDLYEQGIINGYGDGTFSGQDNVSWGQAFKLILLSVGVQADETDGNAGHNWASIYVEPAIENRLVYSFDEAYLDDIPTRLQVARMTARAMDLVSIAGDSPYPDCDDGYVVELYEKGIMEGIPDEDGVIWFQPDEPITRAEMAAILWRVMNSDYTETMIRHSNYWIDLLENVPLSPFTEEQFALDENGRMTYDGGYYALGVDVSEHKGNINWEAVAADGIDFAIIRVGGRLMQSGTIFEDKYARQNIEGALAAGLDVGVYFFSQALNAEEGLEEAEFVLDLIRDYDLTCPVVCDWEYLGGNTARTYLVEPGDITAGISAFCQRVEEEGYTAGVYFNQYCGYIKMDLSKLTQYQFWYADYVEAPRCLYDFQLWQYSDKGKVAGIGSNVDMNIAFVSYPLPAEDMDAPWL